MIKPTIRWCDDLSELGPLGGDGEAPGNCTWDRLSAGVPFRGPVWLGAWWRHLAGDAKCQSLIARDENGQIVGLFPLYRDAADDRGAVLRSFGDGSTCTDHVSIMAADGCQFAVA